MIVIARQKAGCIGCDPCAILTGWGGAVLLAMAN